MASKLHKFKFLKYLFCNSFLLIYSLKTPVNSRGFKCIKNNCKRLKLYSTVIGHTYYLLVFLYFRFNELRVSRNWNLLVAFSLLQELN